MVISPAIAGPGDAAWPTLMVEPPAEVSKVALDIPEGIGARGRGRQGKVVAGRQRREVGHALVGPTHRPCIPEIDHDGDHDQKRRDEQRPQDDERAALIIGAPDGEDAHDPSKRALAFDVSVITREKNRTSSFPGRRALTCTRVPVSPVVSVKQVDPLVLYVAV